MKTTKEEALDRINGRIIGRKVVYYDDSTHKYYVRPASDLGFLAKLMDAEDECVSIDAYSHWCAGTTHGDGYETEEEATAAAKAKRTTNQKKT